MPRWRERLIAREKSRPSTLLRRKLAEQAQHSAPPLVKGGKRRGGKIRRGSKARTSLAWFAATCVLLQLGAGLAFDYCWPAVRFKSLDQQLRKAAHVPQPWQVVCLGSSRTGCCMPEPVLSEAIASMHPLPPPRVLGGERGSTAGHDSGPHVVNLAVPVGDLLSSEHALGVLLEQEIRPRIVVIELLPESLNSINSKMRWVVQRQLKWKDIPRFAVEIWQMGEMQYLIKSRLFPLFTHRKEFLDAVGDFVLDRVGRRDRHRAGVDWAENLGITRTLSPAEKSLKEKEGLQLAKASLRNYRIGGTTAQALDRILERCGEEGIVPVLVAVPVSSTHRKLYSPGIERKFQECVRLMMARHGCRFVDCRGMLGDDCFVDGHHTTVPGATEFSRWFVKEVLIPEWGRLGVE